MKKVKKLFAFLTTLSMVLMMSAHVMAAVDLNAKYEVDTNKIQGWPQAADIASDTGILMDADTGTVLFDKGGDQQRYPASITKIMTLLVAVENSSMDEQVTFTETGVRNVAADSSNINSKVGEVMTMQDCLHALMIISANDAAAQIAEHVGGTEQNFIDMMNQRAAEIGCTNTHFTNSSGLPDENHYSSAKDMALIFREGLKNKDFRSVLGDADYTIQPTNMTSDKRVMHTHHPMFAPESDIYYPGCIGGKTGFTNLAAHTLVTAVEQNGTTYIAVVMHGVELSTCCLDSKALFDYGFGNFTKTAVDGGSVILPKGMDVNVLTTKSESSNGKIETVYYAGDHQVGTSTVDEMAATATPTPETAASETTGDTLDQSGESDNADISGTSSSEVSQNSKSTLDTQSTTTGKVSETKGVPALRKILLMIMAAMVLILIALLAALGRKERKHRR
ncbi:serine hydrolase [Blautia luti]|uniref:serine hydrolase n=1 Tax=Blautia luti TaxID=89014 RepID=UPI001D026625|nr:serine hydrolase [Blautia luti]MCB5474691.1 serine hydrolase [Blautia luti]